MRSEYFVAKKSEHFVAKTSEHFVAKKSAQVLLPRQEERSDFVLFPHCWTRLVRARANSFYFFGAQGQA
jgi:hypothetical protein